MSVPGRAPGSSVAASPGGEPTRHVRIRKLLDASPHRVYRAWSQPEALASWFPEAVEGSLTPGTRTVLVWPDQRVWWDVLEAEPDERFRFRWGWLPHDDQPTEVTVTIVPRGFGSLLTLDEGPFDLRRAGALDAYTDALQGWAEALSQLRAHVDFSVDLRPPRRPR